MSPLLTFVLGAAAAVVLQLFVSYLAARRERRKEAWNRNLNSYQDFYRAISDLIDLKLAGVKVSDAQFEGALTAARKCAYDAELYDPSHPDRTAAMQELTINLALGGQRGDITPERLKQWRAETAAICKDFFHEQKLDQPPGFARLTG
jgi:hypothetical protein